MVTNKTRPHDEYRRQFFAKILAIRPQSVLDLGCGDGKLIGQLCDAGINACGVDPNAELIGQLEERKLCGKIAAAENLPFEQGSFDIVVSEFTVHHFTNRPKAFEEALRVAKRGILFMDIWYDRDISSQRLAKRFDDWRKKLDQRAGDIHWPVLNSADFTEIISAIEPSTNIQFNTSLILHELEHNYVKTSAEDQIRRTPLTPHDQLALDEILDALNDSGMSDDGVIFVSACSDY